MPIAIALMGGLGNQLFQYAMGRSLQKRGYEVVFKKRDLLPASNEPHALNKPQYGLDGFKTKIVFGDSDGPEITDSNMTFRPDIYDPPRNCTLTGHWQSERYIECVADELRKEFVPKNFPKKDVSELLNKILNTSDSVGVHVRRGDYVSLQDYHGLMPIAYYQNCINSIRQKYPHAKPFIFSDDPDWCHENIEGEIISTGDRFWDMHLMSQCQHAVISNSSYGWWAAFLGDNKADRIVCAPRKWFVVEHLDSRDMIPRRWQLMGSLSTDKTIVTVAVGKREYTGKQNEEELIGKPFSDNLDRFVHQMQVNSPGAKIMTFKDVLPVGSPTHEDSPYEFKIHAIEEARRLGYTKILWADSSVIAVRSLETIWNLVEKQGYWISINGPNTNYEWISDEALKLIDRQRNEMKKVPQVICTAFALNFLNPTAVQFFEEYKRLAKLGVFRGPWTNEKLQASSNPDVLGHRHDQSAASWICYNLKMSLTKEPAMFLANEPEFPHFYAGCSLFIERNGKKLDEIRGLHPPYLSNIYPGADWADRVLDNGRITPKSNDKERQDRIESARKFREQRDSQRGRR
jgi:hypothetical protein